jgi:hypothetical protein
MSSETIAGEVEEQIGKLEAESRKAAANASFWATMAVGTLAIEIMVGNENVYLSEILKYVIEFAAIVSTMFETKNAVENGIKSVIKAGEAGRIKNSR